MKSSPVHPDDLFNTLSAKPSRADRLIALRRIHEICRQRHRSGLTDFSVSAVGKVCESEGVLKARALYNAQSSDYKILIEAWAVFRANDLGIGGPEKPDASDAIDGAKRSGVLSRITDSVIRAQVQAILDDRNRLRVALSLAEAEKQLRDIDAGKKAAISELPAKRPRGRPLKNASEWTLRAADVEALKNAISPTFIKSQGWRLGPRGEILNTRGETIYEPGYLQGIKKMLANQTEGT